MNRLETAQPDQLDEQFPLLLAAYDDALAAGSLAGMPIDENVPETLRSRLDRDVAWSQMLRRLLSGAHSTAVCSATGVESPIAAPGPLPTRLGRFHIRQELGRGGFGIVYLAYDPKLGREVALKVPRLEAIADPDLRLRFQQEARAAAGLDHPNLVAVYEAGEEGALCYIASAYCPGRTLSAWLKGRDEAVPFGLAASLIAVLADAVDHAHRRGTLHRDLKPSNILLSEKPHEVRAASVSMDELDFVPRITDFGLAKLLHDDDAAAGCRTQTGAILGTPNYMAPEQAGDKTGTIGPATDVHALGAILYELLTGRPPHRGDGVVETLVLVRTRDPLTPSRLRSNVPRDLETICLKCLHKDPRKRYGSAQALADDLRRFLNKQPIEARRVGVVGRLVLWCRRKPALAATMTAAVVSVAVVAGVGLWQVLEERDRYRLERDRAQAHLRQACQAVDQMLTRVGSERLAPVPYLMTVRRDLFEDAVKFYEELARQEPGDPAVRSELGRAYLRLGKMDNGTFRERDKAARSIRKALAIAEDLTAEFPTQPSYQQELADCLQAMGFLLYNSNQPHEAELVMRRSLSTWEKLMADQPDVSGYRSSWAITMDGLGILLAETGRLPDAEKAFRQAVGRLDKLCAENPTGADYRPNLAVCLCNLAFFLALPETNRLDEAWQTYGRAIGLWQEAADGAPADLFFKMRLALANDDMGTSLVNHGQAEKGEALLRRSLAIRKQLIADHPNVPYFHMRLGGTQHELAMAALARGADAEACERWEAAIQAQREGLKAELEHKSTLKALSRSYTKMAQTRLRLGDHVRAAQAAAELSALAPDGSQSYVSAACLLARCASLTANSPTPAESARTYADQAMKLLNQAISAGYCDLAFLRQDASLDMLRPREDFQHLLTEPATWQPETKK